MATQEQSNLERILHFKFMQIKERNPQYSLRAYAKKVGVSPGTLSLVMLGKRKASEKLTHKLAESLLFDPQECSEVFQKPKLNEEEKIQLNEYIQLTLDQYSLMSEWHYMAMLSLLNISNFQFDAANISKKLQIDYQTAESSIEVLCRLGLIKMDKGEKFVRKKPKFRTPDDISNTAIKKSHCESLEIAKEKLQTIDVNDRDFTSVTLAFDPKKMKQAKSLIRKFEDEFAALMSKDANYEDVYRMSIQLIPLSTINQRESFNHKDQNNA